MDAVFQAGRARREVQQGWEQTPQPPRCHSKYLGTVPKVQDVMRHQFPLHGVPGTPIADASWPRPHQ